MWFIKCNIQKLVVLAALAALWAFPSFAAAALLADQCNITAGSTLAAPSCPTANPDAAISTDNTISNPVYTAARSDPGYAGPPIDAHNKCRYIDNSGSNSLFVPFKSAQEWSAFIQNHPADIAPQLCSRPGAFDIPNNHDSNTPASWYVPSLSCDPANTYPVTLHYSRVGNTIVMQHGFTCTVAGECTTSTPVQCGADQNWTLTAQATFLAGASSDTGAAQPTGGWTMSNLEFSGNKPPPNPPPAITPGQCGPSNGQAFNSAPTSNLCGTNNTASALTANSSGWNWTCTGNNGGTTTSCSATIIPGQCGTSNGQTFSSAPTSNLCGTSNTASALTASGSGWTWTCTGGTTANCSAIAAAPVCSPKTIYLYLAGSTTYAIEQGGTYGIYSFSASGWTVPNDYKAAGSKIEAWGGGAGSVVSSSTYCIGGGGGAYAQIKDVTLTPGSVVAVKTGLNTSTDTYFNGASCATAMLCAKGASGQTGGSASASIGTIKYSGGNGGTNSLTRCGGGGGAAGSKGNGSNGTNGSTTSPGNGGTGNAGFGYVGGSGSPAVDAGSCGGAQTGGNGGNRGGYTGSTCSLPSAPASYTGIGGAGGSGGLGTNGGYGGKGGAGGSGRFGGTGGAGASGGNGAFGGLGGSGGGGGDAWFGGIGGSGGTGGSGGGAPPWPSNGGGPGGNGGMGGLVPNWVAGNLGGGGSGGAWGYGGVGGPSEPGGGRGGGPFADSIGGGAGLVAVTYCP
jgi:hypothetical protein